MAELKRSLPAALALACLLAVPVAAQTAPGGAPAAAVPPPTVPPANSPGAQATRAAPAQGTPTENLFDAIAIGSMDLVRDAVGRGANLNSRNVLGQRPVDLAIDVGRSDIAFLLLSLMRGGQQERPAALPASPPPARAAAGRRAPEAPIVAAPRRLPTLWANDGGAPQPDIGFLGFDASRGDSSRPSPGRAAPRG